MPTVVVAASKNVIDTNLSAPPRCAAAPGIRTPAVLKCCSRNDRGLQPSKVAPTVCAAICRALAAPAATGVGCAPFAKLDNLVAITRSCSDALVVHNLFHQRSNGRVNVVSCAMAVLKATDGVNDRTD